MIALETMGALMNEYRHKPFINPTSTQAIEAFFSGYSTKRYKKGQILILAGETTDYAYYLVEGRMKIYDVTYRGDEIIIDTFRPPSLFPIALIINKSTTRYIYEADTDITIQQAPRADTLRFLDSHPDVVYDLLSYINMMLDDVLERMVHMIASSAKDRLIYSLITECYKFGELQTDGSYLLAISEKELGARAGLSRETVSREARVLKITKLIEVHHNYIIIFNIKKLERYLDIHA
jgi:CRP/FNR family transcriptional regulator